MHLEEADAMAAENIVGVLGLQADADSAVERRGIAVGFAWSPALVTWGRACRPAPSGGVGVLGRPLDRLERSRTQRRGDGHAGTLWHELPGVALIIDFAVAAQVVPGPAAQSFMPLRATP